MAAVIETEGLTKRYGRHTAVENLSFTVEEGEIFGFLGPNGAGKTTTLLMLLGLTEPSAGSARVLGFDPVRQPLEVKSAVGYLPEQVGFYTDMTALENLAFVAQLNNLSQTEAARRMDEALNMVGLAQEVNKLAGTFSRGMRQRLGIAELLIKDPKLIFLDEPTLGLDPDGINKMLDLIVNLAREKNISVLLSSHLLHQVQRICDRVGIMRQGHLVDTGSLTDLAKKMGQGRESAGLEEIYMHYFKEG